MSYPSTSDLQAFVGTIPDLEVDGAYLLAQPLADAIEAWEEGTQWIPYIKDSVDRTLRFDPPARGSFGCVLDLQRGLLALTSVTAGLAYDGSGGSTYTENVDFKLWPYDGGVSGKPWTQIHFRTIPYGEEGSLKVIGRFGKVDSCPDQVKLAIMSYAAAVLIEPALGALGSMKSVKQGPVEYQYGSTDAAGKASSTAARLMNAFLSTMNRSRMIWL